MSETFKPLTEDINVQCMKEGSRIYHELVNVYGTQSGEALDVINNSLLFAQLCLIKTSVPPENREKMVEIISESLLRNVRDWK